MIFSRRNRWLGPAMIVVSALGFGSMALFAHIAYADRVNTLSLLAWRFILASGVMTPLLLARRMPLPRGRTLFGLICLGAIYAAVAWAYFAALHFASSGMVALLVYTYPVVVTLLGAALGLDRFGRAELCALLACGAGLALLLGHSVHSGSPLGIVLALLAGLLYAVYILASSRFSRNVDPLGASWVVLTTAGIMHALCACATDPSWPASAQGWAALIALSVFCSALAVAAFLVGLRHVGPTMASVLSTLEPVVTVTLGIGFLGESLGLTSLAGSLMVLGAVIGLALSRGRATVAQAA